MDASGSHNTTQRMDELGLHNNQAFWSVAQKFRSEIREGPVLNYCYNRCIDMFVENPVPFTETPEAAFRTVFRSIVSDDTDQSAKVAMIFANKEIRENAYACARHGYNMRHGIDQNSLPSE